MSSRLFQGMIHQMRDTVDRITGVIDENGVIIETSSITEEKGKQGVYVKGKNDDFFFVPIKVYASDGEHALIADDFYYEG